MTGSRWRLPDAPLRSSVARAVAAAAGVTLALGLLTERWSEAGGAFLLASLGLFAVATSVLVGRIAAYHPFARFGPANAVTLVRLGLVAIVAGLIGVRDTERVAWLAVALILVATALDGLDGWLARRSRTSSAFGARFDMETDAALILVLSVLVWQHGKAGIWVLACGLMRYAFVAAGWLMAWMAAPLRSTLRGKSVAVGQLVGLGVALSPVVPTPHSTMVSAVTLTALVWSFAVDIRWLWLKVRLTREAP
jgi:phosphatidylglycerophosphate synthase